MNMINDSKYRTKVIQHLLKNYTHQQIIRGKISNRSKSISIDQRSQIEQISQIQLIREQQDKKALIIDMEDEHADIINVKGQRCYERQFKERNINCDNIMLDDAIGFKLTKRKLKKEVTFDNNKKSVNKKSTNPTKTIIDNQLKSKKNTFSSFHQTSEKFTYHQNRPISLQSTQTYKESHSDKENNQNLMNKGRAIKNRLTKSKKAQENNINHHTKKFRFLNSDKVQEALKSRRQSQKSKQRLTQRQNFNFEENKDLCLNSLQSARDKLFEDSQLINSNKGQFRNGSMDFSKIVQQQNQISEPSLIQIKNIEHQEKYKTDNQYDFEIEIELSPNRTQFVKLHHNSNPSIIAKQFIVSNKQKLVQKGYENLGELEQLLSDRIQMQLQKYHKELKTNKNEQLIQEKMFKKIIDKMGVKQTKFIFDDQPQIHKKRPKIPKAIQDDIQQKQAPIERIVQSKQFTHIYIESYQSQTNQLQEKQPLKTVVQTNEVKMKEQEKILTPQNLKQDFQTICEINLQMQKIASFGDSPSKQQVAQNHQTLQYSEEPQMSENDWKINSTSNNKVQNFQRQCQQELNQSIGAMKIFGKSRSRRNSRCNINSIGVSCQIDTDIENRKQSSPYAKINQKTEHFQNQNDINELQKVKSNVKFEIQKKKQQIKENEQQSQTFNPKINVISDAIVSKIGKDIILQGVKKKQQNKRQQIIKEKLQKQQKQMKQCSFKPKINNLSKCIQKNKKKMNISKYLAESQEILSQKLNLNLQVQKENENINKPRYQDLYENHKKTMAKKQYIRQKSIDQLPFKPSIDGISRKIMNTKSKRNSQNTSLSNSRCQAYSTVFVENRLNNTHSLCKSSQRNSKSVQKKRNSQSKFSRNLEGLQIGDYLYKQAMRMKKKRQSAPQAIIQNFRPNEQSEKLISQLKQKRLSQYFNDLLSLCGKNQGQQTLYANQLDLEDQIFEQNPLKLLVPLLQELREVDIGLNRQEFVSAGMKLIDFLSQDQKADLLSKKHRNQISVQLRNNHPQMNKISKALVNRKQYFITDIYQRGITHKKNINEKIQNSIEERVRSELQGCTFNPKINSNYNQFYIR